MKMLAVVSGGMDSVTLAHDLADDDHLGGIVSFDYGQRHAKELVYAGEAAARLGVEWSLVPMTGVIGGASALTSDIEVPDGHYAEDTMKDTVVPNRNAIMLSVATGIAVDRGLDGVATAVHGGDHFIYPDCRPEFITAMATAMRLGTAGFASSRFELLAPYVWLTKADIVLVGRMVDVPFDRTWSCYKGGDIHCGACGTCFERREAFEIAEVPDPTHYLETPDYAAPEGVEA